MINWLHNIPSVWALLSTSDPMGGNGFNEMLFSIMRQYLIICLAALLAQEVLQDLTSVIIELYSSEPVSTFYKWENWGSEKWDDLSQISQPVSSRAGNGIQVFWLLSWYSFCFITLSCIFLPCAFMSFYSVHYLLKFQEEEWKFFIVILIRYQKTWNSYLNPSFLS